MKRGIVCPCGHPMEADDDAALYHVVRKHVDDKHPELNYSRQDVEGLIKEKAFDAPE